MPYVASIQGKRVAIRNVRGTEALSLSKYSVHETSDGSLAIELNDRAELAALLSLLRDLGVAFAGGSSGWPPAEVFADLRDRGAVAGEFEELIFVNESTQRLRRR